MGAGGSKGGVKADINVTPLVDVCLVLLIIFMVVTPMLQRGKDVKLPAAKEQKKDKPDAAKDPLILSITSDKKVYVEQDEYQGDEALERRLATEISNNPEKPILLKGDMTLTFSDVRKVMNVARMAHAKGIELGIEEIKEGATAPQ
jgi:biopolymer transport protein ExbD/biopolymer transport protein TolR